MKTDKNPTESDSEVGDMNIVLMSALNRATPPKEQVSGTNNEEREKSTTNIIHPSSYVGKAFISFALYYLGFYIIGLISNIIFLSEANREERLIGTSPPGKGCLQVLIWIHVVLPFVIICLLVFLAPSLINY